MALYGLKEIFQLASQLEENGRLHYETAAQECGHPAVAELCLKIARQETKHLEGLQSLAQLVLADDKMKAMTWEELSWLQLKLEEDVLPDAREIESFIAQARVPDILARAIQMELDSVTFYSNLMAEVSHEHRGLLEEFAEEEKRHINWLKRQSQDS